MNYQKTEYEHQLFLKRTKNLLLHQKITTIIIIVITNLTKIKKINNKIILTKIIIITITIMIIHLIIMIQFQPKRKNLFPIMITMRILVPIIMGNTLLRKKFLRKILMDKFLLMILIIIIIVIITILIIANRMDIMKQMAT